MISIVITSFNEPKTVGKAIDSFLSQKIRKKFELIVVAPDKGTEDIVRRFSQKNKQVRYFKDPGKGKSYALNLIIPKLRGEILVFTDGDLFVSRNSLNEILKKFEDPRVGCVSARPVPMEDKKTKYGYFANFLFDSAHKLRKKSENKFGFVECSGYLWAFRNNVITSFPVDVAEDTIVPCLFYLKGYKIAYAPKAEVYVKNVTNLKDWLKQKIRTTKAHETLLKYVDVKRVPRSKSFLNELFGGFYLFTYPKKIREVFWTLDLFFLRLYMWVAVFYHTKIKKKRYSDAWERINSTK
ncbi:Glycosyltransferase AglE [uncultured archaeon]|nr:Glycosyltransferase AglE [uncultured archaeon]